MMVGPDMQHNSTSSRDAAFFVHELAIQTSFMVLSLLQTVLSVVCEAQAMQCRVGGCCCL